jgi:hypothetical protein
MAADTRLTEQIGAQTRSSALGARDDLSTLLPTLTLEQIVQIGSVNLIWPLSIV